MAESSFSVTSNNVNNQNQVSALQRTDSIRNNDKKTEPATGCPQTMDKPILLEDYKIGDEIPETIANLLHFFTEINHVPNKMDILVGFVHLLMLETGFIPHDYLEPVEDCDFNYKRVVLLSRKLPQIWKIGTNYSLCYILKSSPHYHCKITCITLSDDLLINCIVKEIDGNEVFSSSTMFDPLIFFPVTTSTDEGPLIFQDLKRLSMTFKNEISFPAKVELVHQGGGVCGCLQQLPGELQWSIMKYLGPLDLDNVSRVNPYFASLVPKKLSKNSKRKRLIKK